MSEPEENVELQVIKRDEPNVTMTHYMLIAQRVADVLHRLQDEIPGLREVEDVPRAFIRKKAGVPRRFVREAVGAIQAHKELEILRQYDGGAMLDNQQYVDAFVPVKQLFGVIYRSMIYTLQWKEAQLASSAQKVLKIVEAMELDSNDVGLAHIHQELKRARRRPRKKKKNEP
jgi:hypothetical protein